MKKFYFLKMLALALFSCLEGNSQGNYTAIRSGNASNPTTWDVNGIPSQICNNCTITINPNVILTLDGDILVKGSSLVRIGTDASSPSGVIITAGSFTNPMQPPIPPSAYHRLDIVYGDNVKVVLANSNSYIDARTTGPNDGVFLYVPLGAPNYTPYFAVQRMGTCTSAFPLSTYITGPSTLFSDGTLPILISHFDAVSNGQSVDLSWTTEIEINADHFAVERSSDGAHWKTIASVAARGLSSTTVNYSYVDNSASGVVNYYKLQMVDRNGVFSYTAVKVVRNSLIKGLSIFPNPTSDYINVSFGQDAASRVSVTLLSSAGQVLQEKTVSQAPGTTISLPVSNYARGNYIITLSGSDGSRQTNTVIISR
jgi:Secretion system C-terminal sorting domain